MNLALLEEIVRLPRHQRDLLVPLVVLQIDADNPGFMASVGLTDAVNAIVARLGDDPTRAAARLDQMLAEPGIDSALVRELNVHATTRRMSSRQPTTRPVERAAQPVNPQMLRWSR